MAIEVEPLSAALGARVYGLDLANEIDQDTFQAIHRAWLEHQVLIFPRQTLSEADQVRFARMFGELPKRAAHAQLAGKPLSHESIMLITNAKENGKHIGALPQGEMYFHTDGAYDEDPYRYTMLFALEVPSVGGHTLFADMYGAYETLREPMKRRLRGLHAVHGFYAGRHVTAEFKRLLGVGEEAKRTAHPVVITHEETCRPVLYVSRMLTESIAELPAAESDALLEELFAQSEQSALVYEHIWTEGDFVIWDNRCCNHARTDFPANENRRLRRTTVQGVRPEPAVITVA